MSDEDTTDDVNDPTIDLYAILEVEENATADQIKDAFRRLSKLWHPDISREPNAKDMFGLIARAYEILRDPVSRAHYDKTGRAEKVHNQVDKRKGAVYGAVIQAWQGAESEIVATQDPNNFKKVDMMALAKNYLNNKIAENKEMCVNLNKQISINVDLLQRVTFKKKSGTDVVEDGEEDSFDPIKRHLENENEQAQRMITEREDQNKILGEALTFYGDYSYRVDPLHGVWSWSDMTSPRTNVTTTRYVGYISPEDLARAATSEPEEKRIDLDQDEDDDDDWDDGDEDEDD